jgi:hypothetical protein
MYCIWAKIDNDTKGAMGVDKGTEIEAVVSEHGASKGGSSQLCTKSHHSESEGYLFLHL